MTEKTKPQQKNSNGLIIWLWLIPALIFCITLVFYWFNFHYLSTSTEVWGQFGDYIGGLLNPVISGCTLIVAISVWRLQENELKRTQELLELQIKKVDQDRSEQRFFDLMNIYQKVVDGITSHPVNPHQLLQLENGKWTNELVFNKQLELNR
jgi:hypothetical protein